MEIPDFYSLVKAGLGKEEIDEVLGCEDSGRQIQMLRKCRYRLLEEIHGKQQALDEIDYMIGKMKERR